MPGNTDRINTSQSCLPEKEIAIIGIGCRFPGGADDPGKFWDLLKQGFDAVKEAPSDRPGFNELFDPDPRKPGRTYSRWGGFLERVDLFDAAFFGISPREAACIDPQHRLLLELVWEACEDAGLPPSQLAGSRTGVFIGISTHDYGDIMVYPWNRSAIDLYSNSGTASSIAANRISYIYDLRGPSFSVDTACSSSLTALHLACQSIRAGDCDLAIVGGVQMLLAPELTIGFCKASMLSQDGQCKAFDAAANGYVRGEGGGVVILKRLAAAVASRDSICGVIRATAINQDGHTPGMTMPAAAAQQAMLEEALAGAGIPARDVQYVEAHGPGTPVGDPIEAAAIGAVMSRGRSRGEACAIGSVKTNIGHLEAASGMAGLIKVVLSLKHRQIPPSLHFHQPNEAIDFESLRLRVVSALEPWPKPDETAIAGLNSFGFGGANAHVVLQEAPRVADSEIASATDEVERPRLLVLSAKDATALKTLAASYCEYLAKPDRPPLRDICYTAAQRRDHHEFRLSVVANDSESFVEGLGAFAADENRLNVFSGRAAAGPPKVGFVFSGMGPQWWGMGRQLLREEPVFRRAIERCDAALHKCSEWSLLEQFSAGEEESRMASPEFAQVSNFAIQAALAELWESQGITPSAVIGHSGGAMAAAYVAGVYGLDEAIRLTYHRSRLQGRPANEGRMLAVGAPWAEVAGLLNGSEDRVSLAAVNGPSAITLAGEGNALERIFSALERRQIFARFLPVTIAYHSAAMDNIREEFLESVADLQGNQARIRLMSDTTAEWLEGKECDAEYWWRAIRKPVLFADGVRKLIGVGVQTFVEISPHPVLSPSIVDCMSAQGVTGLVLPSIRRKEDEQEVMFRSLGALYAAGCSPNWSGVQHTPARLVSLPGYPWRRERHWFAATTKPKGQSDLHEVPSGSHPTLGARIRSARPTWESQIGAGLTEYLQEHNVQGSIVFPGAGYVDMALAAKALVDGSGGAELRDVEFVRPLVLSRDHPTTVQLVLDGNERFEVFSTGQEDATSWICHARGSAVTLKHEEEIVDLDGLKRRIPRSIPPEEFYARMSERRLSYGPAFRGIRNLWTAHREALGFISVPELKDADDYMVHPGLLDSAFQLIAAAAESDETLILESRLFLPVRIKEARVYSKPGARFWGVAELTDVTESTVSANVRIFSETGKVCAEIRELTARLLEAAGQDARETVDRWLYSYRWEPKPRTRKMAARELPASVLGRFPSASVFTEWNHRAVVSGAETGWNTYYGQAEARLNALAAAYTIAAFAGPDGKLRPPVTASAQGDGAWRGRLTRRLLGGLESEGFLRRCGDEWRWTGRVPDRSPAQLHEEILRDLPNYALDLEMLDRCGPRIADVLEGRCDGREVLFSSDGLEFLERYYRGSACNGFYNNLAGEIVGRLVEESGGDRALRILEVGGGTGGATSHILPRLDRQRSRYIFSDVSPFFLERASAKFNCYPFFSTKILDVAKDPAEQGFQPGSFDLIIAANVVHATPRLDSCVRHLQRLLAPGGVLLLVEITRTPFWLDTVFGLMEGWWKFEDLDRRANYPLMRGAEWQSLLTDCGFEEASIVADRDSGGPAQTVVLGRVPVTSTGAAPSMQEKKHWLIFAERNGVGRRLASILENQGCQCILIFAESEYSKTGANQFGLRPDSAEDMGRFAEEMRTFLPQIEGVVHLWSLDAGPISAAGSFERSQSLCCGSVTAMLQNVIVGSPLAERNLILVTAQAQAVKDESAEPCVLQSSVWGLGRVLIIECPALRCRMVDLSAECPEEELVALAAEVLSDDPEGAEEEIALRSGDRLVHRLRPISLKAIEDSAPPVMVTKEEAWRANVTMAGSLDSVVLTRAERKPIAPNEVEVAVSAASLNFRDIVLSMGLIEGLERENSAGNRALGSDFAGTITRCGASVDNFKCGDEVFGLAPASLASHGVTHASLIVRRPATLDVETAASIPLAYVTAWYALRRLARLSPGESVLIHAAAGGVGYAAVQIAQLEGAEIFATAGSASKRAYLKSLGIRHVLDSRTLSFADEIQERTGGRGVDVVLNSLAGEAMERGFASLAPYGRFVELGKADIYQGHRLDLSPFRRNLAFFSVDFDRMFLERREIIGEILREVVAHIASGSLKPPPCTVFEVERLVEGMRFLAQAKHIGKVVIRNAGEVRVRATIPAQPPIRADATYLITGGLGGLGLKVASWMVEQGARALALMGRSGSSPEAETTLLELRRRGARVEVIRGDVSRDQDVIEATKFIRANMPPLRGIIHAAMVLEDRLLAEMSRESLDRVMIPKIKGAWNLHAQTLGESLDFFVSFSSITSVLGNRQQANYAAANAFLDSFAAYRRTQGLKATTINWGVITGAGYVARHQELAEYLGRQGYLSFTPEQVLEVLSELLRRDAGDVMAARIDWRRLSEFAPRSAASNRVRHLVPAASNTSAQLSKSSFCAALAGTDPSARQEFVERYLQERISRLLGASASAMEVDRPITNLGLDSLIAAELTIVLERELSVAVAGPKLLGGITIRALATHILEQLSLEGGPSVDGPPVAVTVPTPPAASRTPSGNGNVGGPPDNMPLTLTATMTGDRQAHSEPSNGEKVRGIAPTNGDSNVSLEIDYGGLDYSRWSRSQSLLRAVTTAGFRVLARVESEGLENIPADGPCIVAVNHLSKADIPLLLTLFARRTIILANEKYRTSALIDWFISDLGQAIYVTPNKLDEKTMRSALAVLRAGGLLALAPEGTRSQTGGLLRGRTGVAYLATNANAPVIPVAAWGQEKWRNRIHDIRRIPVRVRAGEPLNFPRGAATPQLLRQYTDTIMFALARLLPESYRGVYGTEMRRPPDQYSAEEVQPAG